ncbi:MAG: 50S ribosomal protein L4 [Deltaproteobacteria bacterium]|nr:50S ribosomal protein L4 [Deltaproteobacteria bacterium]
MAVLDVVNMDNIKVSSVELPDSIVQGEVDQSLLHSIVKWQLASRRQGTHMTKTKGLVSGGGKKPFKQKGTGNARQGSTRSPLMPGGGTVFGPQPRDYSYVVPKKMRRAGLRMALTHLIKNNKFIVLDDLKSDGKTKSFLNNLKKLGLEKAVVTDSSSNELILRASRNLEKYVFIPTVGLNVYDLLKYDALICTKSSIKGLVERVEVVS